MIEIVWLNEAVSFVRRIWRRSTVRRIIIINGWSWSYDLFLWVI